MVSDRSGEPFPDATHRVYDADEVDDYVASLRDEIARLQAQLDARPSALPTQRADEEAMARAEALLGRSLIHAQQVADQTIATAQRRADEILRDAHARADALAAERRPQPEPSPAPFRPTVVAAPPPPPAPGGAAGASSPAHDPAQDDDMSWWPPPQDGPTDALLGSFPPPEGRGTDH